MTTTNFNKEQLISVPIASETEKGLVERATDVEVATGSDTERYITPKQAKDNYKLKTKVLTTIVNPSLATNTQTYTHSLGKIPKLIKFDYQFSNTTSGSGAYDGTNTRSIFSSNSVNGIASNSAILLYAGTSGDFNNGTISNVTTTTFDVTWTKTSSPASLDIYILITVIG